MISTGTNIQAREDRLKKECVESLCSMIKNPDNEIAAKIKQLRIVRELDAKQYSILKRQLPYFVCGMFNPALRKAENFAYTEYFVLDIDHIEEKGLDMDVLRSKLRNDERIVMMFVSPGQDGLKLLFRLSERCYDTGLYSLFYKVFAHKFMKQYNVVQVIDAKACDVSRACYISSDPDVYYNQKALPVDIKAFVDASNPVEAFDVKSQADATMKKDAENKEEKIGAENKVVDPTDEILHQIKLQLKMKRAKHEGNDKGAVYVPEQLDTMIEGLSECITQQGIEITEVRNIQYAKKISCRLGQKTSETNVFYGKRGYRVVQSPKSGTSVELNSVVAEMIQNYINENC